MNPKLRSWVPGRKATAALVCLLVIVVLVASFDWNWLRRPVERYFTHRSERTVRVADLHVSLADPLQPAVRLRGLYIDNARWASSRRPMAVAEEVRFSFSLSEALQRRWIVSQVVLVDADVDLEIAADGRRNWRLREPDDRGRGRLRVLDLDARRSKIRLLHGRIGLELQLEATPLDAARPSTLPSDPLVTRVVFSGRYHDAPFSGQALTGRSVTFRDTDRFFALEGRFESGKTRVQAEGIASDVLHGSAARGHLHVQGPSLARLKPFINAPFPASRPYEIDAELTKEKTEYTFARVRAEIGETDISGELTYDPRRPRAQLTASLRSRVGHLSDLGSLAGIDATAEAKAGGKEAEQLAARVFSSRPWKAERLRGLDLQLELRVERLVAPGFAALQSLRLSGRLADGALDIDPIELGLADGRAKGRLALDARKAPAEASAELRVGGARLEKLLPKLPAQKRVAGVLDGTLSLRGHGDSLAALMGNASGRLEARVSEGSIASWLDARMALDGGKILRAAVAGLEPIPIRCAALAFEFSEGLGRSRTLGLDTERTQLAGVGSIDLRNERLELVLTPQAKEGGLLAMRKSIHAQGSLRDLEASIVERETPPAASRCSPAKG